MAWCQLEDSFHSHPKVLRVARRLGISPREAHGLLALLWSWSLRMAPDGDLSSYESEDIAIAVMHEGDGEKLVDVLVSVRLLDREGDSLKIHNWYERQSNHKAARQRAERRKRAKLLTAPSRQVVGCPQMSADTGGHVADCPKGEERRGEERNREERNREETRGEENNTVGFASETSPAVAGSRAAPAENRSGEVLQVFAHYREFHPRAHRKPSSKSKEWRLIRSRLEEGSTVEDLCLAIDGCHRSPFHQGVNDRGQKYDSLELIMRDASKVARFLEFATEGDTRGMTERERKGEYAAAQVLARLEALDDEVPDWAGAPVGVAQ